MSSHINRLLQSSLKPFGLSVFRSRGRYLQDGLFTVHSDAFRRSARFRAAYARGVKASAGHDPEMEWRVHIALWTAQQCLSVPGDFVECGVNAGFISSAIMQYLDWNNTGKRFYLVDTFSGPVLEQYSAREVARGRTGAAQDAIKAGAYVTDIDRVRANYAEWPAAVVVQGRVPDVLPSIPAQEVAFLHIDMNCAYPEVAALEFFWPKLSRCGCVLFDDYTYYEYDEQRIALSQAAERIGTSILSLPTGQGLILK